ncbi:MAG TPA: hypothetical protein DDZ88_12795 [Verrucomicrobiales bacterium]|nr:hypothetical protein [Verrucomicrobiales bacterium]
MEEGLRIFDLPDTAAGRRRFIERLEARVKKEKQKECGLPVGEVCKGGQSTLRRGWFWGAQAFEEWLRGKVRESGSKPEGRALRMSAESKACHDEEEAEQVVVDGMKCLHLKQTELKTTVGSDPRKVAVAHAVHQKTAVARQWTAARLEMKSAMNVCQQIKRLKAGKLHLFKEAQQWLSRIDSCPFLAADPFLLAAS